MTSPAPVVPEAAESLRLLRAAGQTLAVAESLTGGLVAAEITAVPGASQAFRGSVTAYATVLKHEVLGVDASLLERNGAVDPTVAAQMAEGVRTVLGADWGLATTGVAGPDMQDGKPVGTVYVAVAGPGAPGGVRHEPAEAPETGTETVGGAGLSAGRRENIRALRLNGDRAEIRRESARTALGLLHDELIKNVRAQHTEQNGGI